MTLEKAGAIGQDPPVEQPPPSFSGCRLLLLLAGAFFAFLLVIGPNFFMAKPLGKLTACKSNCKNLATALEMYAGRNSGAYPTAMPALTAGGYLKTIPTCPESNTDTYSRSYRVVKGQFLFCCEGTNHVRAYKGPYGTGPVVSNFPQYRSETGLIEKP